MNLVVEHFDCIGAGPDAPDEGFEVKESDVLGVEPNDFLLDHDIQELQERGVTVQVVPEQVPHFMDGFEPSEHEFDFAVG